MPCHNKKNIALSGDARETHIIIVNEIEKLLLLRVDSPSHPAFIAQYSAILDLFSQFQMDIIKDTEFTVSCRKGCSFCCNHWVEDVYSFEVEIIADYLKKNFPQNIDSLIEQCQNDEYEINNLRKIIEQKLGKYGNTKEALEIDSEELLLTTFYQLNRPCPLLLENGACLIYNVRPLTCRIYISFSDSNLCKPEFINNSDIATYLCDMEEDANVLLDILHKRHSKSDKSGLRSLLPDYL